MNLKLAILIFFILNISVVDAQRTVGLFQNDSTAFDGYTLFSPGTSRNAYLIDNCGHRINEWNTTTNPGLSCYLLDDGSLLRTGRRTGQFNAGGSGGLIETYDWDGNLTWSHVYSSETFHQHHDVEPLPSGNILVIAWEIKSQEDALANGRDSNGVSEFGLWPDKIVELKPLDASEAEVVWEWHLWDHLIQDFDSTKLNYGVISEHPELLDINFAPRSSSDWIHTNSVEYIEERDEILLSPKHISEIWVIDHSTTTEEARGHTGGNKGMGGDLLYRWGNPAAYQKGTNGDRKLFGQHSAKWIPSSENDPGRIVVFNNGVGRGTYSSIDRIEPQFDSEGNYAFADEGYYAPVDPSWIYTADPPQSLFNSNQGGVSFTPDGLHVLISNTSRGEFIEVDEDKNVVWKYTSPINFNVIAQGDVAVANGAFRVERYGPDYPGLADKDLTAGNLLEINPLPDSCVIYPLIVGNNEVEQINDITIFPTLFSSQILLDNPLNRNLSIVISDFQGRRLLSHQSSNSEVALETHSLNRGIYFIQVMDINSRGYVVKKIVKGE